MGCYDISWPRNVARKCRKPSRPRFYPKGSNFQATRVGVSCIFAHLTSHSILSLFVYGLWKLLQLHHSDASIGFCCCRETYPDSQREVYFQGKFGKEK